MSRERIEFAAKLGGSVIDPDGTIDTSYLKQFSVMLSEIGTRMALVTGGGQSSRDLISKARESGVTDTHITDLLAMFRTREHAIFMVGLLNVNNVVSVQVKDFYKPFPKNVQVAVSGGDITRQTTDASLAKWAHILRASTVFKITRTPWIYEKHPDGSLNFNRPIESISWKNLRKLDGTDHESGGHKIMDGVTSSLAIKHGMTIYIVGKDLSNIQLVLEKKPFVGTRIHP